MDGISGKVESLSKLEGATVVGLLRYSAINNLESQSLFPSKLNIKNVFSSIKKFFSE